ncbi:hypothetical protein [Chroococcus sp. FPU101]|uniref:hypothetical protein n=1 Tax=Chroococcus sp. FPU101 TaxID=1974212 RepID=UPI001A8FD90F|nr:hypothetical protein [Chroococcus sp. FPU101]GFE72216.1 hypothetical protein CFPU101_48260 [Chroococcus sp. FPU101]
MINQAYILKKKVCQHLHVGIHAIASVEEWSNCLFVKIKKGFGKLVNRFVSKKALEGRLPDRDDHYYITIPNQNKTKANVIIHPLTKSILVYAIGGNKEKLGEFDVYLDRIVRGFWGDERLGRCDLRFVDFEPVSYEIGFKASSGVFRPVMYS